MADLKKFYHATKFENLVSILEKGIHRGADGVVYLADSPKAALKFVCLRGWDPILVAEVELNKAEVEESFDHSFAFFKERAWAYPKDIPASAVKDLQKYEMRRFRAGLDLANEG